MDGSYGKYGKQERYIQCFDGKIEEKKPLGRSRHRWEDNIKMELQAMRWEVMVWFGPVQGRYGW
jgi:hypothetical protein